MKVKKPNFIHPFETGIFTLYKGKSYFFILNEIAL